jgi:hypothetical protein
MPDERIRALNAARAYAETALKAAEAMYRVEETKAFMDDVLATLAEVDPELRTAPWPGSGTAGQFARLLSNRASR